VSSANDADADVTAASLRLSAGTAVGDSVNHLETAVATLGARAAGGSIFVLEADDLSVGDVAVSVNRVGSDGATLTTTTDVTQSDVRTTGGNGSIVLRTTAGSITLGDGTAPADDTAISAHGSGNILLQAQGASKDITANADIVSASGNISVMAARSVALTGTADIRTTSTAATSGSIDVVAGTGSIAQSAGSLLLSTGATATARLLAATDVTVGDIEVAGAVSLTATAGSVLDADALVSSANDADADVTAASLRLSAGTAVGQSANHLETAVAALSARAAGGSIFVLEADDLSVGDVAVSVNRVGSDAATSSTTDATQSDVRTTGGNGSIVLRTTAGSITLNDGAAPADDTDSLGSITSVDREVRCVVARKDGLLRSRREIHSLKRRAAGERCEFCRVQLD
jgi:hypothetical protein